jgi:hypothetical protein
MELAGIMDTGSGEKPGNGPASLRQVWEVCPVCLAFSGIEQLVESQTEKRERRFVMV